MSVRRAITVWFLVISVGACSVSADETFQIEEITIDGIHEGIRSGAVTCQQVVEAYVERARAYNGAACTHLVTQDGAAVPAANGYIRAGSPMQFPTETVAMGDVVPDFDKYQGLTPDYGRMESTISDPSVEQQFGMLVGIPNARQVNALETLNLRGERSVSCKGDCDRLDGNLPSHCPAACEAFRKQPDALEVAASLDARFGREPDVSAMPLYCVPISFKAVFDAKDMRSIGGADVDYAMDAPPKDSTLVARMRSAGAIIYAKAMNSEYNGGSGDPTGDATVERPMFGRGGSRETWGGATCNPYDTTRETGGSSGGSGASVAANLVVCSICESTGGSCRNPANYNNVVNLIPTKGMISFAGGIGANPYQDRPGINCRTLADATKVLDAFRDPETQFFDKEDYYTALTRSFASESPYTDSLSDASDAKPLAGMRIGVVREFMIEHTPAHRPVIEGINRELKVLQTLGAQLFETTHPNYPDDPNIQNMEFTFQNALAEIIPFHMPEVLHWQKDGQPEFSVEGWDVTSREYLVSASIHKAPWPENLHIQRMVTNPPSGPDVVTGYTFAFDLARYLMLRGDSRVYDWATLNANAKYFSDARRAAMKNWENKSMDIRTNAINHAMKRRDVLRMATLMVLEHNKLDLLISPSDTALPSKIGGPDPQRVGFGYGAVMGISEVYIPAGFAKRNFESHFVLSEDGKRYDSIVDTESTELSSPLPYNIGFWAGPGDEAILIKVASAYENATRHRAEPPGFGPLK